MARSDGLFREDDDDLFKTMVSWRLENGAAEKRGISEATYVELARQAWNRCGTDQVYALKAIGDPLLDEDDANRPETDEPYLILIARINQEGSLVDAPPDYRLPDAPGVHRRHLLAGSPTGGEEPDASLPQHYLLSYLDVLGFEALLERIGLDKLYATYRLLLQEALQPHSESRPWSRGVSMVRGEMVHALMWMPIKTAYFSDSLLLWAPHHPGHVHEFLRRTAAVFCKALELRLSLRGAITVGRAVLDKESHIYLGQPLVEAARLEASLNWVGIALGASFKSEDLHIPVSPSLVQIYQPPMKSEKARNYGDLVLDWPRVWRASPRDAARNILEELSQDLPDFLKERYLAAIRFYDFSEENSGWFLPPGAQLMTWNLRE